MVISALFIPVNFSVRFLENLERLRSSFSNFTAVILHTGSVSRKESLSICAY